MKSDCMMYEEHCWVLFLCSYKQSQMKSCSEASHINRTAACTVTLALIGAAGLRFVGSSSKGRHMLLLEYFIKGSVAKLDRVPVVKSLSISLLMAPISLSMSISMLRILLELELDTLSKTELPLERAEG